VNMIDLRGRHAIVTGGARGIGAAIVKRFLESGASVSIWDIDAEAASGTARQLSESRADWDQVELADGDAVSRATSAVMARHNRVDILVNNAGISGGSAVLWELTPESWRRVIDVNLIGPYLVCRSVIPHMLKARYGRIVNVSSVAGLEGNPNASHYSASKAALIGMTKSLGKELAQTGVLANSIAPAVVQTDILKQISEADIKAALSKVPMGRFLKVEEAAALVAWLSSEDCSFSTGAVFDVSGGRAVY
jgi:3-oxoacyl-[acyl-carrier protein] reductase